MRKQAIKKITQKVKKRYKFFSFYVIVIASNKTKHKEKNVIKIETTTEIIESKGGLLLAGKVARFSGLRTIKSFAKKKAGDVITCLFGIMVEGKTDFESIGEKRENLLFKEAFGLPFVFAKETVRLYLEEMAIDAANIIRQLRESAVKIIRKASPQCLLIKGKAYLPVDIDTTTMDNSKTKKEEVSRTYQGYDGYHPIFAYVGKEGFMLDCELRPGSQHCQKGTPEFITSLMLKLHKIQPGGRFLFRLDSGNDSWDTLQAITGAGKGHYCIIKRNKRRENDEEWLKIAKKHGELKEPRKGKKVWVGMAALHPQKQDEVMSDINCVFEIIERKRDSAGNKLLLPEIEVNSWWTNLNYAPEKVIELYHDHATSEQFHSELKFDLGVERFASGKFNVNQILLAVEMNAYNTLRFLGQETIKYESIKIEKCQEQNPVERSRKRLSTVIRDIICVAGKIVKHANLLIFKIYEKDPILPVFLRLNDALGFT